MLERMIEQQKEKLEQAVGGLMATMGVGETIKLLEKMAKDLHEEWSVKPTDVR